MFDKRAFKAHLVLADVSVKEMAAIMGINEATLHRKINGSSEFTRDEIQKYRTTLGLTANDVDAIFFAE